jgi:hypothetical protein
MGVWAKKSARALPPLLASLAGPASLNPACAAPAGATSPAPVLVAPAGGPTSVPYGWAKEGFPRQALLMTVVKDERNEGHAVLTVKTNGGEFVLDNMNDEALEPDRLSFCQTPVANRPESMGASRRSDGCSGLCFALSGRELGQQLRGFTCAHSPNVTTAAKSVTLYGIFGLAAPCTAFAAFLVSEKDALGAGYPASREPVRRGQSLIKMLTGFGSGE